MSFFSPSQPTAPPPVPSTLQSPTVPISRNDAERAGRLVDSIRSRFAQTLVGQTNLRESLITTLVAGGHILIESVPGLAKTTAAQTLATSVSGSFKRVQCTPDIMPSGLVGTQVFDFSTQRFTTQIDRSTPISCCSTKSTEPMRKPSPPCWRPWPKAPPPSEANESNFPSRSW